MNKNREWLRSIMTVTMGFIDIIIILILILAMFGIEF